MEFQPAKQEIRAAMLDAQSRWQYAADNADSLTQRSIGLVIADAFAREAEQYKDDIKTRGGWADANTGGHDEFAASLPLPDEG